MAAPLTWEIDPIDLQERNDKSVLQGYNQALASLLDAPLLASDRLPAVRGCVLLCNTV